MQRSVLFICSVPLLLSASAFAASNPFVGHWDFNVTTPNGVGANWLGVNDKGGNLEVWFQPTGGNVFQVKDYKLSGTHLTLNLRRNDVWELDATDGKLVGKETHNGKSTDVTGVPAPALDRKAPKSWSKPEALFDGKDLNGWEPIGDPSKSHWIVQDGLLVNQEHGANLRTTRKFTDFKVHYEVNCPDDANSGFYLRGRYEVQIESEATSKNPPERRIGSIYGRLAPSVELPRTPGQWQTFDVTLVGRTVTVVQDGKTIIDHKTIDGITGGALDANEGEPGPFYIQGDHTGGLKFRNITVSVPK